MEKSRGEAMIAADVRPVSLSREELLEPSNEAEAILNSTNPLKAIAEHLDNIAAGELENKLTIFILLLSGKLEDPRLKEMILLKSESGAGKSTLMRIAECFQTKWVGRLSRTALDHMGTLEGYDVLALKELGRADDERSGISTIKFLSIDDQGYTVEVTVGNPQDGFTTVEKRIKPITVISSTTRLWVDPQYERRNWIISLDESTDQTLNIKRWKAEREYEKTDKLLGLIRETSYERSKSILSTVVARLQPCEVALIFPNAVMDILNTQNLRVRGDYGKVLNIVKYYGFLRQRTLPAIEVNGRKVVLVTPDAALQILEVVKEPLTLMTMEVDGRTKKMLDLFDKLGLDKGVVIDNEYRKILAAKGNITPESVRVYLNFLESKGYLMSEMVRPEGRGQKIKVWELLMSPKTMQRRESSLSEKLNPEVILREMCEEAQEYLRRLPPEVADGVREYFTYERALENFALLSKRKEGEKPENSPYKSEKREISPYTALNRMAKKRGSGPHGEMQLLSCPYCSCLFATESDLRLHAEGLHGERSIEDGERARVAEERSRVVSETLNKAREEGKATAPLSHKPTMEAKSKEAWIVSIVMRERSVGDIWLLERFNYRWGRNLKADSFRSLLRDMDLRGLISYRDGVVSAGRENP